MASRARLAVVAAGLAVTAVVAAVLAGGNGGDSPSPGATPSGPECLPAPAAIATPSWVPKNLPLPEGTVATERIANPQGTKGINRALFAVKGTLGEFVRFATTEWPARGWRLGRGESEPGEAEDSFSDAKGERYGQFIARSGIYCDAGTTWLALVIVKASVAGVPTFTPATAQPSATGTSLPSP